MTSHVRRPVTSTRYVAHVYTSTTSSVLLEANVLQLVKGLYVSYGNLQVFTVHSSQLLVGGGCAPQINKEGPVVQY